MNTRLSYGISLVAYWAALASAWSAPDIYSLEEGKRVATKSQSSAEYVTGDTHVRLGPRTSLVGGAPNKVELEKGLALVSSRPKGFRKKGVMDASQFRAESAGTIQVAYVPGEYMKITCLEGKAKISLKSLFGDFKIIHAGQMLLILPTEKTLPDPVQIDLDKLYRSGALLAPFGRLLPADPLIQAAILDQKRGRSPLQPLGRLTIFDPARDPDPIRGAGGYQPKPKVSNVLTAVVGPGAAAGQKSVALSVEDGGRRQNYGRIDASGADVTITQTLQSGAVTLGVAPGQPQGNGKLEVNTDLGAIDFAWSDAQLNFPVVGGQANSPVDIIINTPGGFSTEGADLNARKINIDAANNVAVRDAALRAGNDIDIRANREVDLRNVRAEAGGHIIVIGPNLRIAVRDSSELRALAGFIHLLSNGGAIEIGRLTQLLARDEILVDAQRKDANSLVAFVNATAKADVIRARAFNTGDRDALVIDGSVLDAAKLIKLYGEGQSKVLFRNQVQLKAPQIDIAGKIVEVERGGVVDLMNGAARVFSDQHRYNVDTFGEIRGQVSQLPFAERPAFQP